VLRINIIITASIALLSTAGLAGCGVGPTGIRGPASDCEDAEVSERILLRTSGLDCANAHAILELLAAERLGAQKITTGTKSWICTGYPRKRYPLKYRCHQGHRYFYIIDTGTNPGTAGSEGQPCVTEIRHTKSRIKPRDSRYTCAQIKSILLVLPNAVGTWPLEGSSSNRELVCHVYPRTSLPLEVRCQEGSREFEIVSIV
jgi:hypothetical protein